MRPTNHLRFVKRTAMEVIERCTDGSEICKPVDRTILQQWWASDPDDDTAWIMKYNGGWFDVKLEKEHEY